jgi:hypothetical protein
MRLYALKAQQNAYERIYLCLGFMVFNTTFNNISVINC